MKGRIGDDGEDTGRRGGQGRIGDEGEDKG